MAFGLNPEENIADNFGDPAWWAKTVFGAIKGKYVSTYTYQYTHTHISTYIQSPSCFPSPSSPPPPPNPPTHTKHTRTHTHTLSLSSNSFETDCAWTASADPNTVNLFFPDQQAMYHVMYFSQFGPGDLAMIEGEFPDTRYFSVQTYDDSFSAVASLKDIDIEAYEGVNPFAKKTNLQIRDGRFKIFLSKDGKRGFPNELPMVMGNFSDTSMVGVCECVCVCIEREENECCVKERSRRVRGQ